jgi:hypothetical protein
VHLTFLPPQNLEKPFILTKINNKLVATLCYSCAKSFSKICNHSDAERAITGTYVHREISLALKLGYKILGIWEIWHYKKETYSLRNFFYFFPITN